MRLIGNWRKSWRMFSMQSMVIAGAIQGAYLALPADMQETIPDNWMRGLTFVLLGLGAIGRLIEQPKVES